MGLYRKVGVCVETGGHMDQLHLVLDHQAELYQLIHAKSTLGKLRPNAVFYGHLGSNGLPHRINDHQWEFCTIFKAAAELIGTGIKLGREHLIQQPAVGAVEHHHLEARLHSHLCRFAIGLCDLF